MRSGEEKVKEKTNKLKKRRKTKKMKATKENTHVNEGKGDLNKLSGKENPIYICENYSDKKFKNQSQLSCVLRNSGQPSQVLQETGEMLNREYYWWLILFCLIAKAKVLTDSLADIVNDKYDIKASKKKYMANVKHDFTHSMADVDVDHTYRENSDNVLPSNESYLKLDNYSHDSRMNIGIDKEFLGSEMPEPEVKEVEDCEQSTHNRTIGAKLPEFREESIMESQYNESANLPQTPVIVTERDNREQELYDEVKDTKTLKIVDIENVPAHENTLLQQEHDAVETLKEELHNLRMNEPRKLLYVKNDGETESKLTQKGNKDIEEHGAEITRVEDFFHMRYFRIKSPVFQVFMVPDSQVHPKRIGDIPWNWLKEELWRLHTFSNYPHQTMKSALLLAENGFAYIGSGTGNDDKVICFFCCRTKSGWRAEDIIPVVHKDLSPQCPMITGINCNNKPMTVPRDPQSIFSKVFSKQPQTVSSGHPKNQRNDNIQPDAAARRRDNDIQPDAVPAARCRDSDIQPDSVPEVSQASRGRQQTTMSEQASAQRQTGPAKSFQMATSSYMRPSGRPISNPASQDPVSVFAAHQPTQNDAPSSTVTSSNPVPQQAVRGVPQGSSTQQQRSSTSGGQSAGTPAQSAGGSTTPAQSRPTGNPGHSPASSSNPSTTSNSSTRTTAGTATVVTSSTTSNQSNPAGTAASTNTTSSTTTTSTTANTNQTSGGETGQGTSRPAGRGPTYGELGIITERPKRYEYAVKERRLETFEHWPRDHHLTKEDLSDAGFYYAGYGDCARCFYCGGGLRNWEDNDNVWVEHARWFPKCAFIRQQMGQAFVEAVQDLNRSNDIISMEMVRNKLGVAAISFQLDTRDMPLKRDPAVKTVLDMGYSEEDVLEAAEWVKNEYSILSADKLFEKLERDEKPKASREPLADSQTVSSSIDMRRERETMDSLKDLNNQLRQQTVCKICMDKEVSIVFLPCGHFVSCTDCAAAMKDCPVCRNTVRGIVRAFMS